MAGGIVEEIKVDLIKKTSNFFTLRIILIYKIDYSEFNITNDFTFTHRINTRFRDLDAFIL